MSSDSDYTCLVRRHTHKRKKIVISDSDSSDDSFIVQTRRKKKIHVCIEVFIVDILKSLYFEIPSKFKFCLIE